MTPDTLAKSGTEHAEQRALMAWCNMAAKFGMAAADNDLSYTVKGMAKQISDETPLGEQKYLLQLEWIHAIHNQGSGEKDNKQAGAIRGGRAKAEGVKAGVADLFLPWPVTNADEVGNGIVETIYCGCYIEMKRNVTTDIEKLLSNVQKAYRDYCLHVGYDWHCCRGWRDGRAVLLNYLGVK